MSMKRLQNEGNLFWGIISSSFGKEPNEFVKIEMQKVLKKGGAFVYIYSKDSNKFCREEFMNEWEINFEPKTNQLQIICLEDIKGKKELCAKKIIEFYRRKIKELREEGFHDIIVYITRYEYNKQQLNYKEIFKLYQGLKNESIKNKVVLAVRYIINDFYEEELLKLLSFHNVFILEGPEKSKVCTYVDILRAGFINLLRKEILEDEYEKELKKIEKLRTVGEISEGFAHDFNNLLTTIVGYSQIGLLKEPGEEIGEYLNVIYKTALDGKAIMKRIQDFIKGSENADKVFHELNTLVLESLDMAKHRIKIGNKINQKIKIIEDLKSDSCIYCNEYEIRQVMLNIILNALDSMEYGGTLTIKTYDLENEAVIEIIDTGMGMSSIVKEKLFEPYFTTKGSEGTGLGLNIAKKILEDHYAEIKVESEKEKGSKFIIYFPILKEKLDEIMKSEGKKLNALIIEKDYIKAYKIIELLNLLNISSRVETLKDEIIEKLSKKEYDLIISIYNPEDIKNIIFLTKLKNRFPEIPFVLFVDDKKKVESNLRNLVDEVVEKECTVEELSQVINKTFNTINSKGKKNYNIK